MSNAVALLDPRVRAVAEALQTLAQRAAGMMPIDQPLEDEGEWVFEAAVSTAWAVLARLDALPPPPRTRGHLGAADAQVLCLELRADCLVIIAWDPDGGPVRVATAAPTHGAGAGHLSPAKAQEIATTVALALAPASNPQTQERTP